MFTFLFYYSGELVVWNNFLAVARKFSRPCLAYFSTEKLWLRLGQLKNHLSSRVTEYFASSIRKICKCSRPGSWFRLLTKHHYALDKLKNPNNGGFFTLSPRIFFLSSQEKFLGPDSLVFLGRKTYLRLGQLKNLQKCRFFFTLSAR